MLSEEFKHSLLRYGNEDQIGWIPEIEAYGMEWADVYIALRGAHNLGELSDIPTEKSVLQQRAMGTISSYRWQKTRWTLVRIPTDAFAVQADSSNIRYVSDEATLDNFTLEEILRYLDDKGYNVDISLKGLQPLETVKAE